MISRNSLSVSKAEMFEDLWISRRVMVVCIYAGQTYHRAHSIIGIIGNRVEPTAATAKGEHK